MKLILAIISVEDEPTCTDALTRNQYSVTKVSTTGGFLRTENVTLLIGCEEEKVKGAIDIIKRSSSSREEVFQNMAGYNRNSMTTYPVEVKVGGATVFVLDVEQFYKL